MFYLRAVIRLGLFGVFLLAVFVMHVAHAVFGKKWVFSRRSFAWLCRLFSIRVHVFGEALNQDSVLYVANHLSYLDIVVLGARLDAVFVAKSDLKGWPLFGYLAKRQGTVFIKRTALGLSAAQDALAALLKAGQRVVVFPEGTSTNGAGVKPFKPGLFEGAFGRDFKVIVQPVAIVLETVSGVPVYNNDALRDAYSWWRPETMLMPHLWQFACLDYVEVSVHFLPALDVSAYADRKALAGAAYTAIKAQVIVPVAQPDRALVS